MNTVSVRGPVAALLCLVGLLAGGCNAVGPRTVETARAGYNQALVSTWNEQLLLNMVRLRYRDTPSFLEVTSINTSYSFSGSLGVAGAFSSGPDSYAGGPSGSWTESPTVTYTPLTGEAFARSLLAPIPLETLFLLPQNGWSAERVLRCCLQSLNGVLNAPSAAGPTPSYRPVYRDFLRMAEILRELQVARLLNLELEEPGTESWVEKPHPDEPGSVIKVKQAAETHSFVLRLLRPEEVAARNRRDADILTARAARAAQLEEELAELVGVRPNARGEYRFVLESEGRGERLRAEGPPDGAAPGGAGSNSVVIKPRSLMGVLAYLAHGIQVPEEHLAAGKTYRTGAAEAAAGGEPFDWQALTRGLMTVRHSRERPAADETFVAVRYRDHWFYIEDSDLDSKTTFSLLAQLFSLQAGTTETRGLAPTLTVGVGG